MMRHLDSCKASPFQHISGIKDITGTDLWHC